MLNTREFFHHLKQRDYLFYSGVPCSFLQSLINFSISECHYVMSVNEGDAVATCAGAALGGKKAVVLMQNSGLTNATSPLTSLIHSFSIPLLGFVSLRGEPGIGDEPQHELMGRITEDLLNLMGIEYARLHESMERAVEQLDHADKVLAENRPFFFVVGKKVFDQQPAPDFQPPRTTNILVSSKQREDAQPSRLDALKIVSKLDPQHILLATTGKTGRELYEIADRANNLYMVGSMGCISPLGLGLAMNCDKKIIAIDGDGALLMRLGNLATNAAYAPANFLHLLLDNACHSSTGGQFTLAPNVDFVALAAAVGYGASKYLHSLVELEEALVNWSRKPTPTFLYLRINEQEQAQLSRPSITPVEVKQRLMKQIRG